MFSAVLIIIGTIIATFFILWKRREDSKDILLPSPHDSTQNGSGSSENEETRKDKVATTKPYKRSKNTPDTQVEKQLQEYMLPKPNYSDRTAQEANTKHRPKSPISKPDNTVGKQQAKEDTKPNSGLRSETPSQDVIPNPQRSKTPETTVREQPAKQDAIPNPQTPDTKNGKQPTREDATSKPQHMSESPTTFRPISPLVTVSTLVKPSDTTSKKQEQSPNKEEHNEDPDKHFRKYDELTSDEKSKIVDPRDITIEINRSKLDPLLDLIKKKGGGGEVKIIIGYFNKTNDKYISTSDTLVRRSLKIPGANSTCRFARLERNGSIKISTKENYRLVVHDYTPYIDAHSSNYDVFKHEVSKERAQWTQVEAGLFYKTKLIWVKHLTVMIPVTKEASG